MSPTPALATHAAACQLGPWVRPHHLYAANSEHRWMAASSFWRASLAMAVSQAACPRNHHPSLRPKYRHSRRSVSAVTARLRATISLIRCAGTPMSFPKQYFVRPSGLRNSSSSISPGETGGTVRMAFSFSDSRRFQRLSASLRFPRNAPTTPWELNWTRSTANGASP